MEPAGGVAAALRVTAALGSSASALGRPLTAHTQGRCAVRSKGMPLPPAAAALAASAMVVMHGLAGPVQDGVVSSRHLPAASPVNSITAAAAVASLPGAAL